MADPTINQRVTTLKTAKAQLATATTALNTAQNDQALAQAAVTQAQTELAQAIEQATAPDA